MGLAPFSIPGTGGSADATQDIAPASNTHLQDFAQARFAQQLRFGAEARCLTPALNTSQSCFGNSFQSRLPTNNFPGILLVTSSAAGLTSDLPAIQFGPNQNTLSSSHPTHYEADDNEWKSPSDFGLTSIHRRGQHNSL